MSLINRSCTSPAGKGTITEYDGTVLVRVNDAWFALKYIEFD